MSGLWAPPPEAPTKLGRHRQLAPLAGVHVSPICLGAMSVGDKWAHLGFGAMDKESSFALLDAFYQAGGNFVDTANNYQDESSEGVIGECGGGLSKGFVSFCFGVSRSEGIGENNLICLKTLDRYEEWVVLVVVDDDDTRRESMWNEERERSEWSDVTSENFNYWTPQSRSCTSVSSSQSSSTTASDSTR